MTGPRKFPSLITLLGVLVAPLLTVTGCGNPPTRPSVAMVVGDHANAPVCPANQAVVQQAVQDQAAVTIVENDGAPYTVATADLTSAANNPDSRTAEITRLRGQLSAVTSAAAPRAGEDDLLDAITLAARYLTRPQRLLLICDDGLQTTGALQFQQPGMLDAQPDELAGQLADIHALPDLQHVQVVLAGIGDVAGPQPALSTAERRNLVAVWVAILTKAGATVRVDPTPTSGPAPVGAPPVTVVPVLPVVIHVGAQGGGSSQPNPLPAAAFFLPDSDQLIDPAEAVETLRPLAESAIREHKLIGLIGTTARVGDRDGQIALSRQRAQAIANLLTGPLGVPASQVSAQGIGSYWPGYVADHDAAGRLLPAAAAQNRTVQVSLSAA